MRTIVLLPHTGGHEMDSYRLYFFNPRGGHIKNVREFAAEQDAAAIDEAERVRGDGPMELWCRTRIVKMWPVPPSNESV
jgi:hypothetical protein